MAGMELLAVDACVTALCAAYYDGGQLVQQIKAKRKAKKAALSAQEVDVDANGDAHARARGGTKDHASTTDLEISLSRGEAVVRSQFDRDFKRFGETFATGDRAWLHEGFFSSL